MRGAIHPVSCETCGVEFLVTKPRVGRARWCSRWCRYGTERDRVEARIARSDYCWTWTGNKTPNGYGIFSRNTPAHRKVYELYVGPIPAGYDIDHLCRNTSCVRPEHLEAVTHRTNMLRGRTLAARHAAATHCPQGHPYDDVNTYWRPDGKGRDCQACRRARHQQVSRPPSR